MNRIDFFNRKSGKKLNKIELFIDYIVNTILISITLLTLSSFFIFVIYFIYKFITFYL